MSKEMVQEKIVVYTDGGSRGNPGPAAIGIVLNNMQGERIRSYGETIGIATNNEAEYRAVISALKKIKALFGGKRAKAFTVEVNMDSELIVRQLTGQYKIEEERLFPFFIKVWNLKMDFDRVEFHHVPREKNREADMEVNRALDKRQSALFKS